MLEGRGIYVLWRITWENNEPVIMVNANRGKLQGGERVLY